MQSAIARVNLLSIFLFVIPLVSLMPPFRSSANTKAALTIPVTGAQTLTRPQPVTGSHAFVSYRTEGNVGCREANEDETKALRGRSRETLHVISSDRRTRTESVTTESTGLQIVLRGTDQLENFSSSQSGLFERGLYVGGIDNHADNGSDRC
jgi:hypothetical protein